MTLENCLFLSEKFRDILEHFRLIIEYQDTPVDKKAPSLGILIQISKNSSSYFKQLTKIGLNVGFDCLNMFFNSSNSFIFHEKHCYQK